jgi:serine/threonine-protein kinase
VIHRHLARDQQISRRFQREARILRKLRGPNLVSLLDLGESDDGLLFMALEFVEGTPLDVLIKQESIEVERAVEIVKQICCALEIAHGEGIIHRDLKPGNVILSQHEDGRDLVRVLDFGLAKALRPDAGQSLTALTQQNMVFGTPEYMAPEQARGDDLDARCDVYATGIILYELLTGTVPFAGRNAIHIMTAHLTQTASPPSTVATDKPIPPALDAAVLHALAKKPNERYATATALATALQTALRRPRDVASTAPPPPEDDDIGSRDTELSLEPPENVSHPIVTAPEVLAPEASNTKLWLWIMLVLALIGIAVGIALSRG